MGKSTKFHDILGQLEEASLDSAEKGNRFERLMQAYLSQDPAFAELYSDVWMWMDYPERNGRTDTGIDLVAKESNGDLTAIQCKFFAPTTTVSKPMIDSFLAASSRAEFSKRMIISTSDSWGKNAEEAITGDVFPPVTRLRVLDLEQSPIDWSQFSLDSPEKLVMLPPKEPREYQKEAIKNVVEGFASNDRGKLIMACGTGKTFTALKLTEQVVPAGGSVLFLVPSISLLSQTVREWTAEVARPMQSFAVCSDAKVGKRKRSEYEDITVTDLAFPATTDGEALAQKIYDTEVPEGGFRAVFSTYQSIGAIRDAQQHSHGSGIDEFDLIICDEAHRTTGVTLADEEESAFVQVHANAFVEGKKRLYMTATPRVYGDVAQEKAKGAGAVLADMDDETLYGPEFHRLGFATAVENGILTDYKVLVLAVDEAHVSRQYQSLMNAEDGLALEDAAKLVGCWNGLAKKANPDNPDEFATDPEPMRRAVAFAGQIKHSKQITAAFNQAIENEGVDFTPDGGDELRVKVRHVDGTQNVLVRNEALDWLRQDPGDGECRILSNARCLSEGVDVPALDSVLFLAPRKSQVDVVQSVGRVMRKLEGKKYGYVVLPIAVPADQKPEDALSNNDKYKVVWQVLQALRSHDERLDAVINKLDLTGTKAQEMISVVGVGGGSEAEEGTESNPAQTGEQLVMAFPHLDEWRDSIFAKIVQHVGDRRYWETWASDIAEIASHYVTRITALIEGTDAKLNDEFEVFLKGLQDNLNPQVDQKQAVEMLAQHLITRPVFDALFDGYEFSEENPVSISMQKMFDLLDLERLEKEQAELESFYRSVRLRASGISDPAAKQGIIKDLYEAFFRSAFKEMADRLGIVYTPVEIVDFILNSADEALREHFGKGITDEGVHVLDPFTGTGTFIVRLIQSGLIKPEDLERKFRFELHANEIVLLAYYVAAINIEEAYHGKAGRDYESFEGIVLTDTFQMHEEDDRDELPGMERFPANNERVKRQKELPIRVIIGNPPYSQGQASANDDNQNLSYPSLDRRIETTYAGRSSATLKNKLYDSYIRAIRLASDRIGDKGVVCFVSNGGYLDSNTADGLRKCLADEFTQISIFNLRGNQRTAGEQSRKEGGKVFGAGSRATVAITLLVKDPDETGQAKLLYRDIGDYLTRDEKLAVLTEHESFDHLDLIHIVPNDDGDWLNQRNPEFLLYGPLDRGEAAGEAPVFERGFPGVVTSRDAWTYGFSDSSVTDNVRRAISFYEAQRAERKLVGDGWAPDNDPQKFSWSAGTRKKIESNVPIEWNKEGLVTAAYRPFCKQKLYFDSNLTERGSRLRSLFPYEGADNLCIFVVLPGQGGEFAALMSEFVPDLHLVASGKVFGRYEYVPKGEADNLLDAADDDDGSPYRRVDNITGEILGAFQTTYGEHVTRDDIFFYVYGLLHSSEYRDRFQSDLKKMLPRIPKVEGFREFSDAGRRLSELHLGYESVDPFELEITEPLDPSFKVKKMKFAGSGKNKDRSTIIYNDQITVAGIPEETYRYMLGTRSAVEWIMDRYQVKTDKKSGITNDPNDWSEEVGDPRYILDLLGRIVRVSIETMKIVDSLPSLELIENVAENEVPS